MSYEIAAANKQRKMSKKAIKADIRRPWKWVQSSTIFSASGLEADSIGEPIVLLVEHRMKSHYRNLDNYI